MKSEIHRAHTRGVSEHGWLSSRFSFSFADWYEPTRMGFRALRVINDDRIAPNSGFGPHGHRDMEIITIVTGGAVTHGDSMGNQGEVHAGEVQVMSAGSGVVHSEVNASLDTELTLFQIWIATRDKSIAPHYAQKPFPSGDALLVSSDGREGSLQIMQDAFITRKVMAADQETIYTLTDATHGVYVFVVSGKIQVADSELAARDAIAIEDIETIQIHAQEDSELLIIEVP